MSKTLETHALEWYLTNDSSDYSNELKEIIINYLGLIRTGSSRLLTGRVQMNARIYENFKNILTFSDLLLIFQAFHE